MNHDEMFKGLRRAASKGAYRDKDWRALWSQLGDIPIDEDEQIEEPFLHFPIGTEREDIWHWFEETFDIVLGDNI